MAGGCGGGGFGFSDFAGGSPLPMDVLEAVLTTAAIDVAVMPLEGAAEEEAAEFSGAAAAEPSSPPPAICVGVHFSCSGKPS